MCVTPNRIKTGQTVACHKCWQCRENKINDWVGRCTAETKTATASRVITLTYGRDMTTGAKLHERAAVLTYSDVQKYIRALRDDGYPCRYFAVGEYGSLKGRAHWHLVVFFQGKVPPHKLSVRDPDWTDEEKEANTYRFMEKHWDHGFSEWEEPNSSSVRYACKYILKDHGNEAQSHLAMSKKPPLGAAYFDRLARRFAEQGLAPQDQFYSFPEILDRNGKRLRFYMKGVTLDNFCESFLRHWRELHGARHAPHSQVIEDYCDRAANYTGPISPAPLKVDAERPWLAPPGGGQVQFSEALNTYFAEVEGRKIYWSWDLDGGRAWLDVIRTEAFAKRERQRLTEGTSYDRNAPVTKVGSPVKTRGAIRLPMPYVSPDQSN